MADQLVDMRSRITPNIIGNNWSPYQNESFSDSNEIEGSEMEEDADFQPMTGLPQIVDVDSNAFWLGRIDVESRLKLNIIVSE
jgi:hypothetical protein